VVSDKTHFYLIGVRKNMKKEKAKEIFEWYNPASDVVRCPRGRANIRKLLDSYARAAVNLYGIIRRDDFVNIFNDQNEDKTTKEEIYILLLPLVLKNGWYGFYKEYIVHYCFFDDFKQVEYLLEHQADKPRYVPDKDEFLKYVDEGYEDNDYWWNVFSFMLDAFGFNRNTTVAYEEIKEILTYSDEIRELGSILNEHNIIFRDEKQLQQFADLIMHAKNNTRMWQNKGHTPSELREILSKRYKKIIKFPKLERTKIKRNDPCPCGSGKKYKKCCAIFDDAKTAQLSPDESRLFYETWFGLISYVNERKSVVRAKIKPEYPNTIDWMMIKKVRDVLWNEPELINEYIGETELPQEKIDILMLWRSKHKKGMFLIMEYRPEYAVAIAPNSQGKDLLYGIKGICNSVANALQRELPVQIETVLLPFKGKIIYDSFMSVIDIRFGGGARELFSEIYDKVIKHGIIESLDT